MVHLNRIYTKTGDAGTTSLGDGTRVPKTHPRIAAYGAADELSAVLGVAIAAGLPEPMVEQLRRVQIDLFDLEADLCFPERDEPPERPLLRVTNAQVEALEGWIDAANDRLQPLTNFIIPGGTLAAAHLHHARTVCRRVELDVLKLAAVERINPLVAIYLNRLSDLLFVFARLANDDGRGDVVWVTGENRPSQEKP